MSTTDRIREYGAIYEQLTQAILELSWVEGQVTGQAAYLAQLHAIVEQKQQVLHDLATKTKKEFQEMQKLKHFSLKRIQAKLSGNINEKIAKEQTEFMRAFETEQTEKAALEVLQKQLLEAQETLKQTLQQKAELGNLISQREELFQSIFQGPTPEFPREAQIEQAAADLQAQATQYKLDFQRYKQAQLFMTNANTSLNVAIEKLRQTLNYNTYEENPMADVIEHSKLASARSRAAGTQALIGQARQLVPELPYIGNLNVMQDNLIGNLIFDNIFTDMMIRDKISASLNNLTLASHQLRGAIEWLSQNVRALQRATLTVEAQAQAKQAELSNERRRIFEQVLYNAPIEDVPGFAEDAPAPLSYVPPEEATFHSASEGITFYPPPDGPPPPLRL